MKWPTALSARFRTSTTSHSGNCHRHNRSPDLPDLRCGNGFHPLSRIAQIRIAFQTKVLHNATVYENTPCSPMKVRPDLGNSFQAHLLFIVHEQLLFLFPEIAPIVASACRIDSSSLVRSRNFKDIAAQMTTHRNRRHWKDRNRDPYLTHFVRFVFSNRMIESNSRAFELHQDPWLKSERFEGNPLKKHGADRLI